MELQLCIHVWEASLLGTVNADGFEHISPPNISIFFIS